MRIIKILLLFNITLIFGQKTKPNFEVNGNLKVLFGNEISIPDQAMIELQPSFDVVFTDSLGNFRFLKLRKGKYKLRVIEYSFEPKVFHFEIIDKSILNFNLVVEADCEVNTEVAKSDLKNGKPKLLLIGGIAPVYYKGQEQIEKKYGFKYHEFGCSPPPMECVLQYNKVIFDYMNKQFDNIWRKDVRKDVVGLKE